MKHIFFYGHVFLAIDTSYFEIFFFYGHVSVAINKSYYVYWVLQMPINFLRLIWSFISSIRKSNFFSSIK